MKIAFVLYPRFTALGCGRPRPGAVGLHPSAPAPGCTPRRACSKGSRRPRTGASGNLRAIGVEVLEQRVVWAGTHVTGAGVSAGIDIALGLTAQVYGRDLAEALQLAIEYDPEPPFASGSPAKVSASTVRPAMKVLLDDRPLGRAARPIGRAPGREWLGSAAPSRDGGREQENP